MSDLDRLAADLFGAGARAAVATKVVVDAAAQDVQDRAVEIISQGPRTTEYASTITHDVTVDGATIVAEIGPDREVGEMAEIGRILESGSVNNAPMPHLGPAVDQEEPRLQRLLGEAVARVTL